MFPFNVDFGVIDWKFHLKKARSSPPCLIEISRKLKKKTLENSWFTNPKFCTFLRIITSKNRKNETTQHKYEKCGTITPFQYTYYAAGLLSEQDKFPENQQNIRNQFLFMADTEELDNK